jgi:hypothetical protein
VTLVTLSLVLFLVSQLPDLKELCSRRCGARKREKEKETQSFDSERFHIPVGDERGRGGRFWYTLELRRTANHGHAGPWGGIQGTSARNLELQGLCCAMLCPDMSGRVRYGGAGASAKSEELVQALHAGYCGRPRNVAEQTTLLAAKSLDDGMALQTHELQTATAEIKTSSPHHVGATRCSAVRGCDAALRLTASASVWPGRLRRISGN